MLPRFVTLVLIASALSAPLTPSYSQAPAEPPPTREELLKAAVSRERGDVTALEGSRQDGSAYIGYSSGALLHCRDVHSCSEFGGTPRLAVRHITVSSQGDTEIVWAAYRHGALYRCVDEHCARLNWDADS